MGAAKEPIAVFDSGVGGISVLAELMRRMPQENYLYFGDSANAPYGSRSPEEVRALTEKHVGELTARGAKAVVIACNTATGAAISYLREKFASLPMIGMEPAIKPAAAAHPGGRILVMATPVTLASAKFRHLMELHEREAEIVPVPCACLARMVEDGILGGAELESYLTDTLAPYLTRPADAVVLGCTHYPFVRAQIARAAHTEALYDGGAGTARETEHQLSLRGRLRGGAEAGTVEILNSEPGEARIRFCRRLLSLLLEPSNV